MAEQKINLKMTADGKQLIDAVKQATSAVDGLKQTGGEAEKALTPAVSNISRAFQAVRESVGNAIGKIKVFGGLSFGQLKGGIKGIAADASATTQVLSQGIQALSEISRFVWGRITELWDSASAHAVKSGREIGEELKRVSDAHEKARQKVRGMMDELASLNGVENKSEVQKQRMIELVNRLAKSYGGLKLSINGATGVIEDFDNKMAELLEKQKEERMVELQGRLNQAMENRRLAEESSEREDTAWRKLTNHGSGKVDDANEEIKKYAAEVMEISRQLNELRRSDPAGEYRRAQEAAARDRALAKEAAYLEKRRKDGIASAAAWEAKVKAFREEEARIAAEIAAEAEREAAAAAATEEARRRGLEDSRERERLAKMSDVQRAQYAMEKELATDAQNGMGAEELVEKRARMTAEIVAKFIDKPAEEKRLKKIDEVKKAIQDADQAARAAAKEAADRANEAKEKAKEARKEAKGKRVLKEGYTRDEDGTYRNAKGRRVGKKTATRWVPASKSKKRAARKADREAREARREERAKRRAAGPEQTAKPKSKAELQRELAALQRGGAKGRLGFDESVDTALRLWEEEDGRRKSVEEQKKTAEKAKNAQLREKRLSDSAQKAGLRVRLPGISPAIAKGLDFSSLSTPLHQLVQNTSGLGRRIYVVR